MFVFQTARSYCAAVVDDVEEVVSHIQQRFPQAPLMAIGISMGG